MKHREPTVVRFINWLLWTIISFGIAYYLFRPIANVVGDIFALPLCVFVGLGIQALPDIIRYRLLGKTRIDDNEKS